MKSPLTQVDCPTPKAKSRGLHGQWTAPRVVVPHVDLCLCLVDMRHGPRGLFTTMESPMPCEPSCVLAFSPRWLRKFSRGIFTGSGLLHTSWTPHMNCLLTQMAKAFVHQGLQGVVKSFTPCKAWYGPFPLPTQPSHGSTRASIGNGAFRLLLSLPWIVYLETIFGANVRVPLNDP